MWKETARKRMYDNLKYLEELKAIPEDKRETTDTSDAYLNMRIYEVNRDLHNLEHD